MDVQQREKIIQAESPQNTREGHYNNWPNDAGFSASLLGGESRTPIQLKISGAIPDYAAGSLYRTGPGAWKVPRTNESDGHFAISHWFDGFVTTHKFTLTAGEHGVCEDAWYCSYCSVDEQIEQARKTGRLNDITFGQKRDPCDTLYKKLKSLFTPVDDAHHEGRNIGVTIRHVLPSEKATLTGHSQERRLMNLTADTSAVKQFDADTLEPLGVTRQSKLHPSLKGPLCAAHSSQDPDTGDIFNYNLDFGASATYRVFRSSLSGKTDVLATISGKDAQPSYLHSINLTKNFVILCIWPAFFTGRGASLLWERNLLDAMKFDPTAKTMWFVVDRHHGKGVVKKFESPAMFSFHTTNAWEESLRGDKVDVIAELVEFRNTDVLHRLYYENMVSSGSGVKKALDSCTSGASQLTRYKLGSVPIKGTTDGNSSQQNSASRILAIPCGDLPQFNENYVFKQHRYVYSVVDRGHSSFVDSLMKTDTETGSSVFWEVPRHTPGEPIFISRPGATDEDDGTVMSVILDGDSGTSYLLCLDARTFSEVGRVVADFPVGLGFHGVHVPGTNL